ncbi:hypothetical protein [Pseudomonas silesiensis]
MAPFPATRDERNEEKPNTGLAPVLCFSSEHKITKRPHPPVRARLAGEGVITATARLKAAFAAVRRSDNPAPTGIFTEHEIRERPQSPVGARLAGEGVITATASLKAAFCFCSTPTTEIRADKTESNDM